MSDFADKLSSLVATELAADRSPEKAGVIMERLLTSLAMTIAISTRGDPKSTDTMLEGAVAYLYDGTAGYLRFGRFMSGASE